MAVPVMQIVLLTLQLVLVLLFALFVKFETKDITNAPPRKSHITRGIQAGFVPEPEIRNSSSFLGHKQPDPDYPAFADGQIPLNNDSDQHQQEQQHEEQRPSPLEQESEYYDLDLDFPGSIQKRSTEGFEELRSVSEIVRPPSSNLQIFIVRDGAALMSSSNLLFSDQFIMSFMGLGFLLTLIYRSNYATSAFNFLTVAVVLQWATICHGFLHNFHGGTIQLNFSNWLQALFAAAAVLVSYVPVQSSSTPLQLLFSALVVATLYNVNEWIGSTIFHAKDPGGSLFLHAFGAFFGLAMSFALRTRKVRLVIEPLESAVVSLSTSFLWLFWPCFIAGLTMGNAHRVLANTYLTFATCCSTAFALTSLLRVEYKATMKDVQNWTMAGGIAIASVADLIINPFGGMVVGCVAGATTVLAQAFITPFLRRSLKMPETHDVHNLHALPGVLGATAAIILSALSTEKDLGYHLYRRFPARVPHANTTEYEKLVTQWETVPGGFNRTGFEQAYFQSVALLTTLATAVIGGLSTGVFMRFCAFAKGKRSGYSPNTGPESARLQPIPEVTSTAMERQDNEHENEAEGV